MTHLLCKSNLWNLSGCRCVAFVSDSNSYPLLPASDKLAVNTTYISSLTTRLGQYLHKLGLKVVKYPHKNVFYLQNKTSFN